MRWEKKKKRGIQVVYDDINAFDQDCDKDNDDDDKKYTYIND